MAAETSYGPKHLDSRVKIIWFMPAAVLLLTLWFISSTVVVMYPNALGDYFQGWSKLSVSAAFFIFLFLFIGGPVFAYIHLEYLSFTYEVAPSELVIREGVLTRNTVVIPYTRIQNISTKRTVFERLIGLATLQIETAGANPGVSEGILPGISKKEELIAAILGKVERAKKVPRMHGGLGDQYSHSQPVRNENELLSDILKELVQLNKTLSSHYGKPSAGGKNRE
jgi:membrane protein YdbS with pleckstrin-like domain